jgi:hypothetical protein
MLLEAVEKPIIYRWPGGEVRLEPGKPVPLPEDRARRLLAKAPGKVRVSPLNEEADWPAECRRSEDKFRTKEARLYPLLYQSVRTPRGPGILVQVFGGRAAVRLKGAPDLIYFLDPSDVRPAT